MHILKERIADCFSRWSFVGPESGPSLLITGGVHGDEFEPIAALRRLIGDLMADSGGSLRGSLQLIPIVNEEAFLRGHRTANDGLDLARTCPGKADGSITERVAFAVSEQIRSADFFIDLHTGGTEYSVLPLTGYTMHPDASVLDQQRQMAQAFNLPVIWGASAELQGRTLSIARDANTPAIYAEYLGAATCDPQGVDAYLQGCLNVMALLGMIDLPAPTPQITHTVEDIRPNSGHMQICNPSPCDGYFHPAIGLGDAIQQGELLGTVTDLDGAEHPVHADIGGILLTMRTFPRVRAQDSVGVILETQPK